LSLEDFIFFIVLKKMSSETTEVKLMKYSKLGNSGLKVSRIALGCMSYGTPEWRKWVLDEEASRPFIQRALELGINFFDTANMYSVGKSEEVLGNALRDFAPGRRDELVIATKVFFPMNDKPNRGGLSRKNILSSIDASLKRLGTDYVDLYQFHRWDNETPIEETMDTFHDLVRSGKVRYIGASSCAAWQFSKAINIAKYRGMTQFISMQNHYNLIYREEEREMNPLCASEGIGLIPWSPLARGLLSGKRKKDDLLKGDTIRSETDQYTKFLYDRTRDNDFEIIERVVELAAKKKVTPSQLSLAWLLHKPNVIAPIVGATKMYQLEEAAQSVHIDLSSEDMLYLEELYRPHFVVR